MCFYVIDQNYFRDADIESRLKLDDSAVFVVTDTALIEMLKAPHWEYISENSLRIISQFPDRISVSESPSDLLRQEVKTKAPVLPENIISDELTQRLRAYLREIDTQGQAGPRHAHLANHITQAQIDLLHQQMDHSRNLEMLRKGYDAVRSDLGADFAKAARKDELSNEELKENIIVPALRSTKDILAENAVTEESIKEFLRSDSFLLRHSLAFLLLCLRWVKMGGIECLAAEKATNDLMDMNYVLVASYGLGILSKEQKVQDQLIDLHRSLELLTT